MKIFSLTIVLFLTSCISVSAQSKKKKEWTNLLDYLSASIDRNYAIDTSSFYKIFAARIIVDKKNGNKVSFNDSTGYSLFPKIDSVLYNRDFSVFLNGKQSGTIIFPIEVNSQNFDADPNGFAVPWSYLRHRINYAFFIGKDNPDNWIFDAVFLPPMIINKSHGY